MKLWIIPLLVGAVFSSSALAAASPRLLGIAGHELDAPPPALVAGETVTLRLLLSPGTELSSVAPRLFQNVGDVVQIPLRHTVTLVSDAADPRITLARFTLPNFTRVARVDLDLGPAGSIAIAVFPSDRPRADEQPLADILVASRLRLAVAGASPQLRAYLRAENIAFTDLGPTAPERLETNALLLTELSPEGWTKLASTASPAGARLIAFVADPVLLPGVYAASAAGRTKVTLPLLPFLMADPRARATLHALLLQTLSPSSETLSP